MGTQSRSSHFRALFESALLDYEKQTDISLAAHPLAEQLENSLSVESTTTFLQDQAPTLGDLQGDDRVTNSITGIVSSLYVLSTSGALGDSIDLPILHAKAIQAGLALLLAAAKAMSASYDTLIDLFESIEHSLRHLEIYTKISTTPAMDEIVVKIMVELLSTLAIATKELRQGRPMRGVKSHLGERDVDAVLQRLDRLTQDEAETTAFQTLEVIYFLVQAMRVVMDDGMASMHNVWSSLETLHQKASDINKSKRDMLQQNIRNWLSPPDPWKNHNIACELRYSGTGEWFVQSDVFSEWKWSGPSSLLWIHGKLGSGKSVICSTVIQAIDTIRKRGLASLAFFYHDYKEDQKQDLRGLLSSILYQLCNQSDFYCNVVHTYLKHASGPRQPSDDALARCLSDLLRIPGQAPVFLIVDALDECRDTYSMPSPREKVLDLVGWLVNSQFPNLRLCVTSRPNIDIKLALEPLCFRSVSLHNETGQMKDIESYLNSAIAVDARNRQWDATDKQLVIDFLTRHVDGMFQWASCQIERLCGCDPRWLEHALAELPETLFESYEHILREINEAEWEFAHRLFQCVAVVSHPIRVDELGDFLAFDFKVGPIPRFHEYWRFDDPIYAILSTCSTLLALVNVDNTQAVQFSHVSVKQFLMSNHLAEIYDNTLRRYHISLIPAHSLVAQACLSMLLHLDGSITSLQDGQSLFPLATYAAQHWIDHAQIEGVSKHLEEAMKQLFDPRKPHFAIWVWLYVNPSWNPDKRGESPSQPSGTPLHYATLWGLHAIVKFLVTERLQAVHARGFYKFATPLHIAYNQGRVEIAQILLENGADATAPDWHGWSPLHMALFEGRVEFARILLENSTNSAAQGEDRLTRASSEGHVDTALNLLENGAAAIAKDRHGCSPLHLASGGHVEVSQILLERGADATAKDKHGWTPLHMASSGGHTELARVLLLHGADATAKDENEWTALHRASSRGHADVVRILLEHGADPDARDNDKYSPLHRAAEHGHLEAVRVLLECGANVDSKDCSNWTPLHTASQIGHLEVVDVLLEWGANARALDCGSWTPLQVTSHYGHLEVVQVLLEHGVDANTRDNSNRTPLHGASGQGHLEVVLVLLEYGADANTVDDNNETPLHLASRAGYLEVVKLLVKHNASLHERNNKDRTAFQEASMKGLHHVTQVLLDHGAEDVTG